MDENKKKIDILDFDALRSKANSLPLLPGVYFMYNDCGEIIYIGKAKKLKNRVSSYFHGEHLPKVTAMISKIAFFDVIITKSEFEALLLENKMIKQYMPHYNIELRDDKGYPYIAIDLKSEYPRFEVVGKPIEDDKRKYYGPYGSRSFSYNVIETVNKALMLPTCEKNLSKVVGKTRTCINNRLGVCEGWCCGTPNKDEYRKRITKALYILDGRSSELKKEIEEEMLTASEAMEYEKAASFRDLLRSVESLGEKKHLLEDDYSVNNPRYVYNGDHYSDLLMEMLNSEKEIHRIEAFDISNLGRTNIVACMTVFQNGKPLKRDYRKFKIDGLEVQDDYQSIYQAVFRRFKRYKDGDQKFSTLPDLILIDGGSKHCAKAENALSALDIQSVICMGMVKDGKHRTRALINSAGMEISIKSNQAVFSFIGMIQEETHRSAITYQKKLREESLKPVLENIKGVGPKRVEKLYKQFKTINGIKNAEINEISKIVPIDVAVRIKEYFLRGK